jgi:hypothetical protein
MYRKVVTSHSLLLFAIFTLAHLPVSLAQERGGSVTLYPRDTGRSVALDPRGSGNRDRTSVSLPRRTIAGDGERFAVKTNLPYLLGAQTPNVAFEWAFGPRSSVEAAVGLNKWGNLWDFADTGPENDPSNFYKRRLDHFFIRADYHWWLRESFRGHYLGGGLFYSRYRVGEMAVPGMFEEGYDYWGNAYGVSLSYGWVWRFARRWAAEFSLGLGAVVMPYDKSSIQTNLEGTDFVLINPTRYTKICVGPTAIGVKLVFFIK